MSIKACQNVSVSEETRDKALRAYRAMLGARTMESKLSALYKAGMIIGGVYLGRGQEAISASLGVNLIPNKDFFAPAIRDGAGRVAWGEALIEAPRAYFGSVEGPMRGRDGNVHRGFPAEGYLAMISHLGSAVSVVAGCLFGKKIVGELGDSVGVASVGDGTTSTGAFHEAVNLIAVEQLPVLVCVTNNLFAYSTPNSRQFACTSLAKRLEGYGIETEECNGTDFWETFSTISRLIDEMRKDHRPRGLVCTALRLCGHGEHDDASYIPQEVRSGPYSKDCLMVAEEQLLQRGWVTPETLTLWKQEISDEVVEAVARARREAVPDPFSEDWQATQWTNFNETL